MMKIVILAAGRGIRLEPLTANKPKQMLLVAGKPFIGHLIDRLTCININKIFFVIGVLGDGIREYVNLLNLPFSVDYIEQIHPKGTGHATSIAGEVIDSGDPFLLIHGDVIPSTTLLMKTVNTFQKYDSPILISSKVDKPDSFGMVRTSGGFLNKIIEKPKDTKQFNGFVNVGLYVITPEVVEAIKKVKYSPRGEIELTDAFNIIASRNKVKVIEASQDEWIHIGYPWDLLNANISLLSSIKTSIKGELEDNVKVVEPVILSKGSCVKTGSIIEGPSFIGEGSEVGPNIYIRKFTCIDRNVKIGNACEIKNSIVMQGTRIPHLSYVGDSIIGERCNLGAGTVTANLRFDENLIKTRVKGLRVSTGERKFGVILGDNVKTGVNVNFMPGVKVGEGSWIGPNIAISKEIPPRVLVTSQQKLVYTDITSAPSKEKVKRRE